MDTTTKRWDRKEIKQCLIALCTNDVTISGPCCYSDIEPDQHKSFVGENHFQKHCKKCSLQILWTIFMSEMHVAHTKPLSRMQSLSESCRESKVTKPVFSNSAKRYFGTKFYGLTIQMKALWYYILSQAWFLPSRKSGLWSFLKISYRG